MSELIRATIAVDTDDGWPILLDVQFNPRQLDFDRSAQFADMNIPGLDVPITQYVRGSGESLTVDLFFDTTDDGMAEGARDVRQLTDRFTELVMMNPTRHAPPVCTFSWGPETAGHHGFRCVVESVKQRLSLFSTTGVPLRATLSLKLKQYRPLEEQRPRANLTSPDRTHAHVVTVGERLCDIAARYYRDPGVWRAIADANGIDDPRTLRTGAVLTVPPIR